MLSCQSEHSTCKHVFTIRVENSVDPNQMASSEATISGSTVFSEKDKSRFKTKPYVVGIQ